MQGKLGGPEEGTPAETSASSHRLVLLPSSQEPTMSLKLVARQNHPSPRDSTEIILGCGHRIFSKLPGESDGLSRLRITALNII